MESPYSVVAAPVRVRVIPGAAEGSLDGFDTVLSPGHLFLDTFAGRALCRLVAAAHGVPALTRGETTCLAAALLRDFVAYIRTRDDTPVHLYLEDDGSCSGLPSRFEPLLRAVSGTGAVGFDDPLHARCGPPACAFHDEPLDMVAEAIDCGEMMPMSSVGAAPLPQCVLHTNSRKQRVQG